MPLPHQPFQLLTVPWNCLLRLQNHPSCLNHYRPISNLPFLSKTLERLVATQLQTHLHFNNLSEPLQSGFYLQHSTETALFKVLNNLLISADTGALNILIDPSAAFDTVCHNILLTKTWDLKALHSAGSGRTSPTDHT
ncbi:putative RNA-directed DNA polymerase from transposon X-element [Merluccius polli]|uniref:RNA-directed DNA polymerase from transposon X-element n=1 Tax=Merluccius polli TaxID=89951 RepID=A0AA47MLF1_MERPO|nr:putative RNA-directed DNA polymerase from transposon X-element [Merluccius polli]